MRSPAPATEPDPTLTGRLFLLLRAVLQNGVASTDDALLPGEKFGKRLGNPKLLGIAVAEAHRRGWIRPKPARHAAARLSRKSSRTSRASGLIELWTRTETTQAAFEMLKRRLMNPPTQSGLFEN